MGDHLQTEAAVPFFILSQIFFSHYHSFSIVLKHGKRVHFLNVIQSQDTCLQLMSSQSWASQGQRLSFLACNNLWPCAMVLLL